ncbi:MAG: nucleoside triphosphate pyrophosphohydrolase [Peptococcaceae bacterium]|nr:nucleoside triphosphate pyrophosphohydrolase [Peptococcaceae bacterium]
MVKPLLHIIGLGFSDLDKLPLAVYRTLGKSRPVFVLADSCPAVMDMQKEGLLCVDLFSQEDKLPDTAEQVAAQIAEQILSYPEEINMASIALPGNPLREGRLALELQKRLNSKYELDLSLLPADDSLERLLGIMAELRSRIGCPWDREQTHQTLKKYLIEEAYEVIEAIESASMHNLCEELGDLLLQVVFHSQIAAEAGQFSFADILKGISDKLVRRHPHVFSTVQLRSSEEVLTNWDIIKKKEKAERKDAGLQQEFFNLPKGLPSLQLAEDTQKKAAKVGFDWQDYRGPCAKIYEELAELEREIGDKHRLQDELGDLLFSIVNLARFLGINAEEALRQSTKKFQKRFNQMLVRIQQEGLAPEQMNLEQLDIYWEQVKNAEKFGT